MKNLSVVIVTYNRLELLKECIDACLKQTIPFKKIIIVNNASTDGTGEYLNMIKKEKKGLIELVNSKENIGGSGGFYLGVKHVLSLKNMDYVLLIDDDAIIEKKYNEKIMKEIEKNPDNISGYSGTVKTDNIISFDHRRFLKPNYKTVNSTESDYESQYFDYEISTFCGLYISTKIISEIGLPCKEFFIWFDDTEYSLRLAKYGKIRNVNSAILNHKTKIDMGKGYCWKSYYGIRNQYVIIRKYYGKKVLLKFLLDAKIHEIGGYIYSVIKHNSYYKKVARLYIDAVHDAKHNIMGKNEKYTYKYVLKK